MGVSFAGELHAFGDLHIAESGDIATAAGPGGGAVQLPEMIVESLFVNVGRHDLKIDY